VSDAITGAGTIPRLLKNLPPEPASLPWLLPLLLPWLLASSLLASDSNAARREAAETAGALELTSATS